MRRQSRIDLRNVLLRAARLIRIRVGGDHIAEPDFGLTQQIQHGLSAERSRPLSTRIRLLDINEPKTVVGPKILRHENERLFAIGNRRVVTLLHPLAVADAKIRLALLLAPNVLLRRFVLPP